MKLCLHYCSKEHLAAYLCYTFRACLARGYIPKAWRQVKVTLSLNMGNYTAAKAYLPITLASVMLKTIEILVDRHVRDEILRFNLFTSIPFCYQLG